MWEGVGTMQFRVQVEQIKNDDKNKKREKNEYKEKKIKKNVYEKRKE
jgi:hypothetical protein